MNIKSLLLGSAAASMLAVSGAQAADPIIYAEPEPMEYVRICDVYGAGYYYIPGTETCLRIGGFVRYQVGFGNGIGGPAAERNSTNWNKGTTAEIVLDARSETEWGTLRGLIVLEAGGGNLGLRDNANQNGSWLATAGVDATHAVIQLGGLFMGFGNSYWATSSQYLGSSVGNFGTHSAIGGQFGGYGFQRSQMIGYHYLSPEGFYGGLALEHNTAAGNPPGYMPNIVARLAYGQAWGGIYGVGAYDSWAQGFGGRLGVELNVPNSPGSQLRLYGLYRSAPGVQYGPGTTARLQNSAALDANTHAYTTQWGFVASYNHNFGNGFSAGLAYQHNRAFAGQTVVGSGFTAHNMGQIFAAYTPVTNFTISADVTNNFTTRQWTGAVRFQRNF